MAGNGDLVMVEWQDAHSESSWDEPAEALKSHVPAVAYSVGWILKRDKVGISLYASIIDAEMVSERLFILDGMIKKVTVLKKAKKART